MIQMNLDVRTITADVEKLNEMKTDRCKSGKFIFLHGNSHTGDCSNVEPRRVIPHTHLSNYLFASCCFSSSTSSVVFWNLKKNRREKKVKKNKNASYDVSMCVWCSISIGFLCEAFIAGVFILYLYYTFIMCKANPKNVYVYSSTIKIISIIIIIVVFYVVNISLFIMMLFFFARNFLLSAFVTNVQVHVRVFFQHFFCFFSFSFRLYS